MRHHIRHICKFFTRFARCFSFGLFYLVDFLPIFKRDRSHFAILKRHSFIPGCFSLCTYLFWPQKYTLKAKSAQVNLFQKRSFMNQLTHNMTHNMATDCSLIYNFLPRKIQIQNMLCTKIVLNAKTKTNFCAQHVLNLYFPCMYWSRKSINNLSWYRSKNEWFWHRTQNYSLIIIPQNSASMP